MSTPEERLAALLRSAEVPVRGDGLSRIQARLVRRRRTRWVAPVAALATAGAVASVLVLAGGPDRDTLTITPASPSATPEPSVTTPATPLPCPSPLPDTVDCKPYRSPSPTAYSYDGPFLWPPASLAGQPGLRDPQQVAQRFVTEFLRVDGVTAGAPTASTPGQTTSVRLRAAGRDVSVLTLEPQGQAWVVTYAGTVGGSLDVPGFGEAVTSPLEVSGTLEQAVDDNVRLTLLTREGKQLAQTSAPAGSAVPWSGTLTWTDASWSAGGVVGVTRSLKDGSVTRVFATPVVRATGSAAATFAGIVDGHVSAFATDGSVRRQLTYPPAGSRDVEADFNGSSALVVRSDPGTCRQRLIRVDGTRAGNLMEPGTASLRTPRLSPSGDWVAWVLTPCSGGASSVVVQQTGKPARFIAVPRGHALVDGVRDDGTLLVRTGDTAGLQHYLVPPTATGVTDGLFLAAGPSCLMDSAAAFDGRSPVIWEQCRSGLHLVRYDGNGTRGQADPDVPLSDPPERTSVSHGQVLLWLFGGDSVGEVARYQDGAVAVIVRNTGCTSVSEPKGCVRDPSW